MVLIRIEFDAQVDRVEQDLNDVLVLQGDQVRMAMRLRDAEHVLEVTGLQEPAQVIQVSFVEASVERENPLRLLEVLNRTLNVFTGLEECLDALFPVI